MATTEEQRNRLRAMTRGAYDLQKLRIQAGLRLCANFRSKLGQAPGDAEEELDEEATKILDDLRASYRRLTDGIARNRRLPPKEGFKGDELISEYTDLMLVASYFELESVERKQFDQLKTILPEFPVFTNFLDGVRGIGPAMAGVIISEIDIRKAEYPSSLWKYAGLDVGPDGRGRSRRAEHLIDRKYVNAGGEEAERKSITYNPFLKTKLMGVVASSFLRSGSDYAKVYRDYRHRLESDPARADWAKGRRHQAALRYMVKTFLKDLYNAWRPLEGLAVAPTYHEAKLGHVHRSAA